MKIETEFVNEFIALTLDELKKKYKIHSVKEYLDQVHESILLNLEVFKGQKPAVEEGDGGIIIDYLKEYELNIILDNSRTKKCPVIVETSPTYNNLFGYN